MFLQVHEDCSQRHVATATVSFDWIARNRLQPALWCNTHSSNVVAVTAAARAPQITRLNRLQCWICLPSESANLMFFKDNFKTDPVLQTLFLPKTKAIKSIWQAFENYVTV